MKDVTQIRIGKSQRAKLTGVEPSIGQPIDLHEEDLAEVIGGERGSTTTGYFKVETFGD